MKTKIKNSVMSALLGVAVLGGAVLMQSFGEKTTETFTFVRVSGDSNSIDPLDYEYHPTNQCIANNPQNNCSADWSESSTPNIGDNPTGTLQPASLKKGSRLQ
ncbi:hypothetical protein ORI89_04575 [Sphingobacterium sp. UT-1RO-CII-1]|uniref:hypothetical protein n=1 Tax=Sphingobacterium sp. UT-1RO-CII-1 TaxID=2995225 RepID=UPI00227BD17F|nr:hypothetical protein [Sphingobacterium sp. UT-1RO-CII-1]MCY4778913.1 hypothetical protein [Sphingobacterium sp. UT-1RO-CII-1]